LTNEQQLAVLQGQKLVTSVLLVKALGGGWDASSLAIIKSKPIARTLLPLGQFPLSISPQRTSGVLRVFPQISRGRH
jgi:hypothetical protein